MKKVVEHSGFVADVRGTDVHVECAKRCLMELVKETHDGDLSVIYFSGHGWAVPDSNGGDEDGKDECLVFANGPLRDDWGLFQLWPKANKGARFIVVLEACHSLSALGDEVQDTIRVVAGGGAGGGGGQFPEDVSAEVVEFDGKEYVQTLFQAGRSPDEIREELGIPFPEPTSIAREEVHQDFYRLTLAACGDKEKTYSRASGWWGATIGGATTVAMQKVLRERPKVTHEELWNQVEHDVRGLRWPPSDIGRPSKRYHGPDSSLLTAVAFTPGRVT
jgi:hypothetical protein